MRITIEPSKDQNEYDPEFQHPRVVVEIPSDDLELYLLMDLIKGAVVAWGYTARSLQDYFEEEAVLSEIKKKGGKK